MFIRKADVPAALQTLRPGSQWIVTGDEYSGIQWLDTVQTCPTEEEVAAEIIRLDGFFKLEACKNEAKKRIADTDWAVLPDVNLQNKADFVSYRATLRGLITSPVENPGWPTEPQPIWA